MLQMILIVSTVLEFNPLLQFVKSMRRRSVADVSVGAYLAILTIGVLWLLYGIEIGSLPLIIGNAIKLFTSLSVVCLYLRYRHRTRPAKARDLRLR